MSEFRQDPTTRNWVIVAPDRARRPGSRRRARPRPRAVPETSPAACPFCPGREHLTPPELWRLERPDGGWRVRVVPNKFPVLRPDLPRRTAMEPDRPALDGHGHHEVVIESPRHDWDLATASRPEVRDVVGAWRARYRALRAQSDGEVIVIFRNHGRASGTSLDHPHSQIIAAPVVPQHQRRRHDVARDHFGERGTHLYVDLVERERRDGRRIVIDGRRLVAFQPFASSATHESWIVPHRQQPSFGQADDATLDELADILHEVLAALHEELRDPPYNLVVHSAPPDDEGSRFVTWYVQIVPRLTTPAGFELATGIAVNPSLPEETAASLRAAVAGLRREPR